MDDKRLTRVRLGEGVDRAAVDRADWAKRSDHPLQNQAVQTAEIRPSDFLQQWEGFGGAVSEIGAEAVMGMPADSQKRFFRMVFGAEGLAMQWVRLPVGSSDFARDAYSYADHPEDLALEHFSIERDRQAIIPYLKEALRINPDLRIYASPWSPPGWMKFSGKMDGEADGTLRDEKKIRKAYARYLRLFTEAYAAEGLPIARLMVQNEMDSQAPFPSCAWNPGDFVRFHLDYLGPEWEAGGCEAEIWAGTFRSITGLQELACLDDPEFRRFVHGVGVQYTFPSVINTLRGLYPNTKLMHTESVCHNGANTEAEAAGQFLDWMTYVSAGAEVFTYWNVVLDHEQKSGWGWSQNSLFTVNTDRTDFRANPDYHVYRLIAQHLKPGAVRLACWHSTADMVAFRNPDGSLKAFLCNLDAEEKALSLKIEDRYSGHRVPPRSLCVIERS